MTKKKQKRKKLDSRFRGNDKEKTEKKKTGFPPSRE